MSTFQLIVGPLLAAMIVATALATARRKLAPRYGVAWLLLWLAGLLAVIDPNILVRAAHLLGIGRGVDLVLYLSILITFVALFAIYLRFRRIDEQITRIVRHLAIRDHERDAPPP